MCIRDRLVSTGWSGGPYGVGKRMKLGYTRAMVRAALSGDLDGTPDKVDPIFGLAVPLGIPDVPSSVLEPRETWSDETAYDLQAKKLAGMFRANFEKFSGASDAIKNAGPKG